MTRTLTHGNFENQLLDALLHEHRPAAVSPLVTARRLKARQLTAGVIGTAAVTTAVAVGVSILREDPKPANTSRAGSEDVTPFGDADAALIVDRSSEAIAASDATILRAEYSAWASADATGPMSRTDFWFDQSDPANVRVLYYGEDGQPTIDEGFLREGDLLHAREVDHIRRVVTETRAAEAALAGEAPPALDVDPAKLTAALAAGELTLVGEESIAGVAVLHLRGSDPTGTRDIWVDAATYLPARAEASGTFGRYRIEYQWMPSTEASAQELLPAIPEGYQVVEAPN